MKYTTISLLAIASVICIGSHAPAIAQMQAASNIRSVANLQQHSLLKQAKVASCSDLSTVLQWRKSDLKYTDGELSISGTDDRGGTYRVEKGTGISGCEIWSADLGANGIPDLLILTPGEDSSGGYDSELSILLFGDDGRPFPWKAVGKFTSGKQGIEQIISNASPGGHAGVIVQTKEGLQGPDANLAFQLYSFSPSGVVKIVGSSHGLSWPVFANPTPELIKHQKAGSLAFDQQAKVPFIRLKTQSVTAMTAASKVDLENGHQLEPPAILVEDSSDGSRLINFDPIPSDITKLISQSAQIVPMGTSCEEEECRPLMWLVRQ